MDRNWEDSIPTLTITFSKVMCDSTGADVPHAPSIKQTVMIPDVAEVVVVDAAVILEKDVAHLEEVVIPMVVFRLLMTGA